MSILIEARSESGSTAGGNSIDPTSVAARVASFNWDGVEKELNDQGSTVLPELLSREECQLLAGLYKDDGLFRSRVVMGRHGFGRGEYKYFSYPLPAVIQELRTALYSRLAPIANSWNASMNIEVHYPESMATLFNDAIMPANNARHLCFFNTMRGTITAFIRTSTESTFSQSRWLYTSLILKQTFKEGSSFSQNNAPGCNLGPRLWPCVREMQ